MNTYRANLYWQFKNSWQGVELHKKIYYFCNLMGLTGFDSGDSGLVSMPGVVNMARKN
jgi:hypothetical protein